VAERLAGGSRGLPLGTRGQNTAPLSENVFRNHVFLKYTGAGVTTTYYDPSYGVTYPGPGDFQTKAIAGFGARIAPEPATGNSRLKVRKPSATNEIVFHEYAARLLTPPRHIHATSSRVFQLLLPTKYTND
jgi:hypothetical protein